MSKGLLFGNEEGMVLTSIASLLCAGQCANLLTYLTSTLIPEASTKLPTYRGEKQAHRLLTCLETVNQWEPEPRSHPRSPWLCSPCLFPFLCLPSLFAQQHHHNSEHFHCTSNFAIPPLAPLYLSIF